MVLWVKLIEGAMTKGDFGEFFTLGFSLSSSSNLSFILFTMG